MDNVVVTAYIAYSFCMFRALEAKGGRRLAFLERLRAYGTAKLISERRNFVVVVGASVASIVLRSTADGSRGRAGVQTTQ